ncbi:MAG: hypothetical protein A2219_03340 [Elusimicrobia bacterium RIFOXYA2_FULL_50_26]|nr:MAG: hypothetical protein A2219_03340 [Elusimicrobia bacterium RIFOXYA2_FULL_50_26]
MAGAKTLLLGLGNTILCDDAAGIMVAREIGRLLDGGSIDCMEASCAGWRLVDILSGYEKAVIIDAIVGSGAQPGECCRVIDKCGAARSLRLCSSHGMGMDEAIALARSSGRPMPEHIAVYAIEVVNPYEFGEAITPEVAVRIPAIARQIIDEEKLLS